MDASVAPVEAQHGGEELAAMGTGSTDGAVAGPVSVTLQVHTATGEVQLSIDASGAQAPAPAGGDAEMAPADGAEPAGAGAGAVNPPAAANGFHEEGAGARLAAEGEGAAGAAPAGIGAAAQEEGGDMVDALHEEILRFATEAAPTADEVSRKEAALQTITAACQAGLGGNRRMRVQLFGSGAHGIALRHSDLDVVVTNFITPFQTSGAFTSEQKELVGHSLRRISDALMRRQAASRRPLIIYNARVPVAKADMSNGVRADISIGGEDGPNAARFLLAQQERFAMLRPLCMVVKALLLDAGLHEVGRGGVSTWSLANMALALLLEQEKAGCATGSAGHLLLGFLKYYGRVFDYTTQAVAVARGGIVPKSNVPLAGGAKAPAPTGAPGAPAPAADLSRQQRLCVEDPITGRDVASGSHQIQLVAQVLRDAASKLELLLKSAAPPPGGFLPLLINIPAILEGRAGAGGRGEGAGAGAAGAPTASPVGAKRPREGPGAGNGGPRKGGPGPRPMLKQQGGGRPYGGSVGLRAGVRPMPQQQYEQQYEQQQPAAPAGQAGGGLQGPILVPAGGMLPAGMMVQQSMPGMQGVAAVMLPMGQQGQAPQQIFLPAQQGAQQQQLAQFAPGAGAAGGLLILSGQPAGMQAQPALGAGGMLPASFGQQQAPQQMVLTPVGGLMMMQPGGVQQQQPGGGVQQPSGVVYFQQGGYMQ